MNIDGDKSPCAPRVLLLLLAINVYLCDRCDSCDTTSSHERLLGRVWAGPFASSNQRRRRDAPTNTHEHHQPVRPHLYKYFFFPVPFPFALSLRVSFAHFLRVRIFFFYIEDNDRVRNKVDVVYGLFEKNKTRVRMARRCYDVRVTQHGPPTRQRLSFFFRTLLPIPSAIGAQNSRELSAVVAHSSPLFGYWMARRRKRQQRKNLFLFSVFNPGGGHQERERESRWMSAHPDSRRAFFFCPIWLSPANVISTRQENV